VQFINDALEKFDMDKESQKRGFRIEIKKYVDEYLERMPLATSDEILIEKSPQYSGTVTSKMVSWAIFSPGRLASQRFKNISAKE